MRFMEIFQDITRSPLKPTNFMYCSLVRLWLGLGGHFVMPTQGTRNLIFRVFFLDNSHLRIKLFESAERRRYSKHV